MNIKKSFLVALATVTAAASVSAVAVSAENALGLSSEDVKFNVKDGAAVVSLDLEGGVGNNINVAAEITDADIEDGEYFFHVALIADAELEAAFDATYDNDYKALLDISFTDAKGDKVELKNVKITIKTSKATSLNAAFVVEGEKEFKALDVDTSDGLSFVGPHFSKYVIAAFPEAEEPHSSEVLETSTKSGTTTTGTTTTTTTTTTSSTTADGKSVATSDTGATTAAVFAVMGVVALGTAFAASKSKKASK